MDLTVHDDLRIGSLFSGYGGLDLGMQQVFGGSVAWHVEFDPAPSAILHHHWPDVPNYGDVTAVDWESVEPVDILTGGFPCQDVSLAGLRRGLKDGTRSGLWSEFARAIDVLRPSFVVIENVRGLLSATADRQMESSPWGLGDRPDGPALRALGAVLGDLADLGYDAEWCGLRAADAGAPHGRYRVFVLAYPADPSSRRLNRGPTQSAEAEGGRRDVARNDPRFASDPSDDRFRIEPAAHDDHGPVAPGDILDRRSTPDTNNSGRDGRSQDQIRFPVRGAATSGLGRCPRCGEPANPTREDIFLGSWCDCAPAHPAVIGRPVSQPSGSSAAQPAATSRAATNSQRRGSERRRVDDILDAASRPREGDRREREWDGDAADDRRSTPREWGPFGPAIRRWEFVTGRVAPAPTNADGRAGAHRLAPEFVEWMMGLPAGHVTEAPVTRTQKLKALGNGVVPQQAALAVRTLLDRHIASRST